LILLVCAGFLELAFSTMTQAIVQMNAPPQMRGRVIGLYNMSSLGMRAGSGLVVGLSAGLVGIHASLALACLILLVVVLFIYTKTRTKNSFT
jgi:MFS family permease